MKQLILVVDGNRQTLDWPEKSLFSVGKKGDKISMFLFREELGNVDILCDSFSAAVREKETN